MVVDAIVDTAMNLYLDLCCFNRPFDDQSQLLVRLQTEAKLAIQEAIRDRRYTLVWSAVLDLENADNPDRERMAAIEQWKTVSKEDVATSAEVEQLAMKLADRGLKAMDALHVSSAIHGGCQYFLTTDKQILRNMIGETRIKVFDPVEFIREVEASDP